MTSTSDNCCEQPVAKKSCCCCDTAENKPAPLPQIDRRGDIRCRFSDKFRMRYSIEPGLYMIGSPSDSSPVLVTANYRLTTNHLQKGLGKTDAWILVLNTKGINVWCAAGKGTFGTKELINRIDRTNLASVVKHRKLILPQLGAPGVAAHEVTKATGFSIVYGPIRAADIPAFIAAGNKATAVMRTVTFSFKERVVLIPMELNTSLRKLPWILLGLFFMMGLEPSGILFETAIAHSWPIFVMLLLAVIPGSMITPALLPWIPFRGFALKGAVVGAVLSIPQFFFINTLFAGSVPLALAVAIFITAGISYLALNFTGCTPITNISGVKREMRIAVPVYVAACVASALLLVMYKLHEWSII
jgi:hypothetical protein